MTLPELIRRDETALGAKHDAEKPRFDLVPFGALSAVARVLTFGARKYAPDGWRYVQEPRRRYYAASLRHLIAWWSGERNDPESGEHHLAHALCCLMFLVEMDETDTARAKDAAFREETKR